MQLVSHWLGELEKRLGADVAARAVDRDDFVEIGGRRVFYQQAGEPGHPPIVFLHGAGSTPRHFPVLLEGLAQRGFFAVAPEHPGMGRSEHLASYGPDLFRSYALTYHRFLEEKGLREPIVVAQSFGGGPANALANLKPGDVAELHGRENRGGYADYRPRALVLVDAFLGQPLSRPGLRRFYGRLLRNLGLALQLPSRRLRRLLTSSYTGAPASYFRDDVRSDAAMARALGDLFVASTEGEPTVEVDYLRFMLGGRKRRPLILVWGEHDGRRLLDYGEWGAKLTSVYDARALYEQLLQELSHDPRVGAASDLVRMSVIPNAGHAGLYTRSHMNEYLDEIVRQLRETGVLA